MRFVNTAQVEALRELLASSGWLDRPRQFARALRRRSVTPQGLLIVGTPDYEPWHMTAHLEQESQLAGLPELAPTLVRWAPPADAPGHLRVGLDRIEQAGKAETLLVVGSDPAPGALLERVWDARKAGAAILALDQGDEELDEIAHEALAIRPGLDPVSFDGAQHLVSLAVGEPGRPVARNPGRRAPALRSGLARLLNAVSGPADV
ncbi:MAG TPA: hypothetical protein VF843_16795 [Streptosporangiaceae bacterium]